MKIIKTQDGKILNTEYIRTMYISDSTIYVETIDNNEDIIDIFLCDDKDRLKNVFLSLENFLTSNTNFFDLSSQ